MPNPAAKPVHPVELSQTIDNLMRCQDDMFRVVRRMSAHLRRQPASPELAQPFCSLVRLLAEHSDHTTVLARALMNPAPAVTVTARTAPPEVRRDSPSMLRIAALADQLATA